MCKKHPFISGSILTRHHLQSKYRGGKASPSNLLNLWDFKHRAWHHCFQHRNLQEIITELNVFYPHTFVTDQWQTLFKYKTLIQVKELLIRVQRIKRGKKEYVPNWKKQGFDSALSYVNH